MSETVVYVGPTSYFADRLEGLASSAGLAFRSKFATHELVLVVATIRPNALMSFCQAEGLTAITA